MAKISLSEGQYAVIRAETSTGHVFTTTGTIYMNDSHHESEIYAIFNSLKAAQTYIGNKQRSDERYEFCIYNWNYVFVEF